MNKRLSHYLAVVKVRFSSLGVKKRLSFFPSSGEGEVLEDGGEEEAELLPCSGEGAVLQDGGEEEAELLPCSGEGEVLQDGGEEEAELLTGQTLSEADPPARSEWQKAHQVPEISQRSLLHYEYLRSINRSSFLFGC